ncbi:hypothetical protein MCOR27_007105 [Pyricularia oryzae]|uniref:Glycoside hydrolase 131 catalytic N-terminal domain-containing protein n=2 Tax=Pyricularia TaxID=48558 RepID=A0ABQ8NA64_PYRGI|nr:hypothetical protein MCOR01_002726 [Pyricularia oryzae]KAI6293759.1 hypothetical protein MCOR33_008914 [Pyricularia grisea]KAH9433012.1 hypothetical protein MCOR02_007683 [Pyricularia oryzae]KAI6258796.1 hypothetical protein MCOR19_004815 [Pyricularia oryzae]KAI6275151.1 hypothetical protein MCOR27_007105 [Pyricularia oryzae]
MKATFVTLIGLLATSVAATPLHPHVGVSIVARGDAKEGGDAKQGSDAKQGGDAKKNDKNKQADKAAGKADKAGASGADKAVGGAGKAGAGAANNATAGAGGAAAGGDSKAGALVLPDGRIKKDAKPEDFNVLASVFKSAVVKGDGLNFSDIVSFPNVDASLFDKAGNTKAFAINIDDKSIFIPKGGEPQSNIRRADLLPSIRSQLDNVAVKGVRTLHFSVQRDATKPLNETHDYQLVNLESGDFSFHQFDVRTGADNKKDIAIFGNSKAATPEKIFSTPFGDKGFENFALKLDFDANTMQVFHSTGNEPLKQATEPVKNDLAGLGEYHFSLVKNPVGTATQPTGIKEAIIYGGIFMEDSTGGKVTLQ